MTAKGKRGKKPRMGRPPAPPETVRRNRVTTTLTDAELAALERMADQRGLPTGTMLYELVRRALRRHK
jgi:hypothetical protein